MSNKKLTYYFDTKRDRVQAYFHEFKEKGKKFNPRYDICSFKEAVFIVLSSGRKRKRSEREFDKFCDDKREEKLKELIKAKQEIQKEKAQNQKIMLKDAMQTWLDDLSKFRHKNTIKEYSRAATLFIKAIGNLAIIDIKKNHFVTFKILLNNLNLSTATQYKHFATLQTFFNWAVEYEYIDKFPKIPKPQKTKKEPYIYSWAELQELITLIKKKIASPGRGDFLINRLNQLRIIIIAIETAMRGGEIHSLPLKNIDLSRKIIYIRDVPEIGFVVKTKVENTIPISKTLENFLIDDLSKRNPTEKWYIDNGSGGLAYKSEEKMCRPFSKLNKELGFVGIKPLHGIRATVITHLLEQGVEITTVQKLARHSSILTTKGYQNTKNLPVREALELIRISNNSAINNIKY